MDKLRMQTANKADENFKKLAAMFPNAVTETINENGEVVRAIDKDVLMQEISCKVVDGNEERYQFTWPDKKKSVLLANAPINKTLRPCREESVDFDTTENLYIEGDNLEVLKLLQETYTIVFKIVEGNIIAYQRFCKFSCLLLVLRILKGHKHMTPHGRLRLVSGFQNRTFHCRANIYNVFRCNTIADGLSFCDTASS